MTDVTPFVWALLAACCWGFAPGIEKLGLRGPIDPIVAVFIRSIGVLIGIVGFWIVVPRLGERLQTIPVKSWLLLLAGGILASILGQTFFYRALKEGEVSRVVAIGASYPVLAFLLGVFFFNESLTPQKIAGITMVIGGVYLLR